MFHRTSLLKKTLCLGAVILMAVLIAPPLGAQTLDLRAGRYTDRNDFFVGAGLLSGIASYFYFNPNVEWVLVSKATYLTFNFDFHYNFYTTSPLFFWLGAGLGVLYYNPEGAGKSNTDYGANLLFGLGIKTQTSLVPYVQLKLILADRNEFVVGIGLRL